MNPDTGHGKVWYEAPEVSSRPSRDGLFEEIGGDEKTLLSGFWDTASKFDRLVSFNGRSFDGPFLSVRSAIHGVAPSRSLAGYRYSVESHVDLMEILTFQGAAGTRPSLHAACVAFGIPSPKSAEMHGYAVGDAYAEGRLPEILDYCRRDVDATAELLRRVEPTLLPLFRR
ncbi:MAG: ribonuclease H-like domain-containing protein [Holophagales bacterium]|nr:ribonuclease H-like domain-containing protein [Holophagales bacterium]